MNMRSVRTAARAARRRFAAIVLAGSFAVALAGGASLPPAQAAWTTAAPQNGGTAGQLAAIAALTDARGAGGPLAVNTATGSVYVAEPFQKGLSVLNGLTGKQTGSVTLSDLPAAVAVDSSTGTIYATFGQSVAVISGNTNKVTTTVTDASSPRQIAVDPVTDTVYVTNASGDSVTVIDGSTNAVTTTVSTGHAPAAIAVDPATDTVYASSADGTVSVINGATNTVTTTITVGTGQDSIAVNPQTNTVYAGSGLALAVIDGGTNTVTTTLKVNAESVAANPATNTVYIVTDGGAVFALNGRANTLAFEADPLISGQSAEPSYVAIDPVTGTVFAIYTINEEFGNVSYQEILGYCASGVAIKAGTGCAKAAAQIQPTSVSFANPAHGVLLGALSCGNGCTNPVLMATADGGTHWSFLPQPPSAVNYYTKADVLFTSPGDGWLYDDQHTTDGGSTWQQAGPLVNAPHRHVVAMAAGATTIYAAVQLPGSIDGVFTRPVGGSAWTRVPGITADVTGLATSGRAVWVTSRTHLWTATDGRHWHSYPARCPGTGYRLAGVTAASPAHVAFLCARASGARELLTSATGGRTVHLAGPVPASGAARGFASPPGNPAVITLTATDFFGSTFWIYRSANAGRTWTTQKIRTAQAPDTLIYTNRTTGWIALAGTLLHTTDSGRTWRKINPYTAAP